MTSAPPPHSTMPALKVFITGASSGIGQALAQTYVAQGATLGLVARREAVLQAGIGHLPPAHTIRAYAADVRDAHAMREAALQFIAEFGCPDIVIANAGISVGTLAEAMEDLEAFRAVMDTNWLGMLHTFQPFIAPMRARAAQQRQQGIRHPHGGTLVGIASVAGVRGLPGAAAYSASKSAVIKTLESMRLELHPQGLRVVTIAPGYIRTAMTAHNPYPMPFLMDAEVFAAKAVTAIARQSRFRVIPWQMGWVASLLHLLPRPLYDALFTHAPRKPRQPPNQTLS